MNGDGCVCSKISGCRSTKTLGANGRNDSRCLMRALSTSFMLGKPGWTTIERLPRRRGPHSMRPLEPADDIAFADFVHGGFEQAFAVVAAVLHAGALEVGFDLLFAELGAEVRIFPSRDGGLRRARRCCNVERAPKARPSSPAAGWMQVSRNGVVSKSLPLATLLSTQPPAITSRSQGTCLWSRLSKWRYDLLEDALQAEGQVHVALGQLGLGRARRAEQLDHVVGVMPLDGHLAAVVDRDALVRAERHEVIEIELKAVCH